MAVAITIFIMSAIFGALAKGVKDQLDQLDEEIAILKEVEQVQRVELHQCKDALRFYAKEEHWTAPNNVLQEMNLDKGFLARTILERWGEE